MQSATQKWGEIRLHSADPFAAPDIRAGYLTDPEDIEHMLRGVRLARRISPPGHSTLIAALRLFRVATSQSDDDLRHFIRSKAETIYHPVGTCKMGSDPLAVVERRVRRFTG